MTSAPHGPHSWRNPRLSIRLALGFSALVAMMLVVVGLATLQFRELAGHGERMMRQDLQRMLRVQQIDQHVQGHGSAMARLLTSPRSERERIYPVVDAEYAAIEGLLAELSERAPAGAAAAALGEVALRGTRYRDVFIDIVTEIEAGDPPKASAMFNGQGQVAMRSLLAASQALLRHEQERLAQRQEQIEAQIRRSEWLLRGLALAAVALSLVLAWRTTVSVARPLAKVVAAAGRIAGGDYAARIELHSRDELGRVARAMNSMAEAVAAREAVIGSLAYVDRLTGLPNRTMLRRLAQEGAWRRASVVLMDVARLRTVNEVLGFETGDALLVQIADRLRAALASLGGATAPEPTPVLARLPGGVFAVVSQGLDRPAVEALRDRLDCAITAPVACGGHAVDVQLVYGLAGADAPASAQAGHVTIDTLLQRAELAVGEAKRQQLGWAWHVAADDAARARQLSLLSHLRHAAAVGELEMWLQPKQCLRSGRILGMEGLVRWRHPERGYVSPAEFIPFAERTGHIGIVTAAMLESALKLLATWSRDHPDLSIAINVSALDVRDAGFPGRVAEQARRLCAPLERLRLEITESAVMEDPGRVRAVLHELRALGVQLSIDDFGTGYSSMAYLQRLPVNELKIDRSFVAGADRSPESRALLATIIELGHSLKMCVTAEGIERAEESAVLAALGCDQAQGYLVSKPLSPDAAARYVRALNVVESVTAAVA
ncbi:MAG: EAL domain-containing protein [Burkholderiales bacterium]|nr:EAL domain-containing protein [Burkholderiales bacterium]